MSFFYARIGAVTGSRAGRHTRLQKTASGPWRRVARLEAGTAASGLSPRPEGSPGQTGLSAREGQAIREREKWGCIKPAKA